MKNNKKTFALEILHELTKKNTIYKTISIISLTFNAILLLILFKIRG